MCSDKKITKYIIIELIIILIYLILDYFNIFSCITQNLNINLLNAVVNSSLVIFVFLITYSLVDKRSFEKDELIKNNKICTLNIILSDVYSHCNEIIDMLENDELMKKYLIPKIDFNSTQNQVVDNLKKTPFKNEIYIVELFSDGIVTKEVINNYFKLKKLYQQYIEKKITFFDVTEYNRKDIYNLILKDKRELKRLIEYCENKLSCD